MNDQRIRVLLIEDNPGDVALLRESLGGNGVQFDLLHADRLLSALPRLPLVDVALLDLSLPDSQGIETFHRLHDYAPDLPVVVLTGLDDEGLAVSAMQSGAQDYVVKARMDGGMLSRTIRYAIERQRVMSQLDQTTRALRSSEARYRSLVERIPAITYVAPIDAAHIKLYISPQIEAALGFSQDEWIADPQRWLKQIHLDDRPAALAAFAHSQAAGVPFAAEYRMSARDGRIVWFRDEGVVESDEAGLPCFIQGIMWDITTRKHMEEDLNHSYSLLHAVVEGVADAIYVKDRQSRYLMINTAGANLLGVAPPDVVGKDDIAFFAPDASRRIIETDRRIIETGETLTYESTATIAGVRRIHLVTKGPYRDRNGDVIGVFGISRDITEQKRLEAQFLQAQKMESIGRMAGGVAHDFNNLLTAIIGYAELAVEDSAPNARVMTWLGEIRKASLRAAGLTRQLLAFAREQAFEPEALNLNDLILETEKLLRRLIGEHIEFLTSPAPQLGQVRADANQIVQVLVNLAVNARDAMPQGGRLLIETANVTLDADYARQHLDVLPGPYVLLAVSDTGCGMTEEVRRHLFEPFFTTKEVGKGTGLGLATCYGIVKQHGGSIWVYSEVERGATVKVYLPRVDVPADARAAITRPALQLGNETVLLVEDEPSLRDLAMHVLRAQGYTVVGAAHGIEALELLQARDGAGIDMLITDVVMPQLGGKLLSEQVIARYPEIKILFISGYTDNAITNLQQLGVRAAFLQKPFSPAALARKVREVLDC